ncbi:right-handed parallel beta-helix repeat-containing protein [Enhygromyxa salina]|uniref:Right handed beta helix domain-containing protein n=1 Tax=Enhygromyxa salina TaxID=215803 RepID=A0A2S9Y487_9BACT|nr:right-handed parallel beta-helix repeat-containing protein [Enhygromyxa salina]PRP99913.1 hypothetical protein ENSA7_61300 [Enhygromyxa salina]
MTKSNANLAVALTASLLAFAAGVVVGCTDVAPAPDHCTSADGAATCADRYGDARPYCTTPECDPSGEGFGGCVEDEPTAECNYACGGDKNILDDDSCVVAGDGDGDPTGDGDGDGDPTGDGDGDTLCSGPADCVDPLAPFCDLSSGLCVDCAGTDDADGSCAGLDSSMPVCEAGVCVACAVDKEEACVGATPICDVEMNQCVGCSDHEQCAGSACNLAEGSCVVPANIVHVNGSNNANCDPGGGGAEATPYCTLGQALTAVDSNSLIILHEVNSPPFVYPDESNMVQLSVAILAAPGETPVLRGTSATAALTVANAGSLFMRGVTISNTANGGTGIVIAGGGAWIEGSHVVNNSGGGIVVDGGGSLFLENSFVGGNVTDVAAVDIIDGAANVLYSTLVAGTKLDVDPRALGCGPGAEVTVRNSILVSPAAEPEVQCAAASIESSVVEDNSQFPGNAESPFMSAWFDNYAAGDFHLSNTHPAVIDTAATWQSGDLTTDIDGDPRPTTHNAPDFAGADGIP